MDDLKLITALDDAPSPEAITGFRTGMMPFWHPVLEASALECGGPTGVRLLGRNLVLARLDGEIVVFPDVCRHFQARLSLGTLVQVNGEQALQCPYHGWAFGTGGRCVRIPQLAPGRKIPMTANLTSYRAVERYGIIWVCLADEATFPIPDFPEMGDTSFRKVRLRETKPMRTSSTRMIMGTLDDTHFPWVHEGILGDRNKPEPPNHKVWRQDNELVVQYEVEQPPGLMTTDMSRPDAQRAGPVRILYTDHVGMPNVIRLVKDTDAGRYVIWLATSPVDYNTTINFWIFARNYDLNPASDAAYEAMSAHVRLQDKPIIESQRPWLIPPFWTRVELPMGPGDLPLMEYQKWIEELGIATAI
ncbi:aromatic ring-hydroxylating oxygenase subunit alpha [Microvirga lotononidis]|uniref:Ring-hydroxylating dioxygenase, large terminal subunit n=1 Tax=Microvirga lotononidis TaxID=864069 RepID=I4YSQ7_9HYPH|nr:aromatic ring-hydroxylating dioxygenase subunit alpha [Microvirga lotononidis]EIM26999.1 ring-hydroxylating dioxygenase, large terminal subunit [Microvirga lotononidis]WQO28808.1 aromatic ring-hydroxylating dioxygenase subunit alpha [Microvirga lotononidis]